MPKKAPKSSTYPKIRVWGLGFFFRVQLWPHLGNPEDPETPTRSVTLTWRIRGRLRSRVNLRVQRTQ